MWSAVEKNQEKSLEKSRAKRWEESQEKNWEAIWRKGWAKSREKDGEKKVVIGERNVEKGIFQHEICMALNEW